MAGGVNEDRREEDDRGIQVEHCRDTRFEEQQRDEQPSSASRQTRDERAGEGKEPVIGGDGADEQQTRDKDERRPSLRSRATRAIRCRERGDGRSRARADERDRWNLPAQRLPEERARDVPPLARDRLELRGCLGERDVDDLVSAKRGHAAKFSFVDEIRGL